MGPKNGLNGKSLCAKLLYYVLMNCTQGIRDIFKGFGDVFFFDTLLGYFGPMAKIRKQSKIMIFKYKTSQNVIFVMHQG